MEEELNEEGIKEAEPEIIVDYALDEELMMKSISLVLKNIIASGYIYTKVNLSKKKLTNVNYLGNYPHLFYVDVSNNFIESIDFMQFICYALTFNASYNRIEDISPLNHCQFLSEIDLQHNNITEIPPINIEYLTKLNLNFNKIETFLGRSEKPLINGNYLRVLEARNNLLTSTAGLNIPRVTHLYLAANHLLSIENVDDFPFLSHVHLRDNQIRTLDGFLHGPPHLVYLNLRNNSLSNYAELIQLQNLSYLSHLVLAENDLDQSEESNYRIDVLKMLPHIKQLDKDLYEEEEYEILKEPQEEQIKEE